MVGSTSGRTSDMRVVSESVADSRLSANTVSPLARPRTAKRPTSPSNLASKRSNRSVRENVARLIVVVRCSAPAAGTCSTSTSVTRMLVPEVSMVDEANPTCRSATARR